MATLKESIAVEYYDTKKSCAKPVNVLILLRGNQPRLQIVKVSGNKYEIKKDIDMNNIGAVIRHKFKIKRKLQESLTVAWNASDNSSTKKRSWEYLMLLNRDNNDTLNKGIEQLKQMIFTKCGPCFKVEDQSGDFFYLQCTRKYMAIISADDSLTLTHSELTNFHSRTSGSIYGKGNGEISLTNEASSYSHVIELLTSDGRTQKFTISDLKTADMISRAMNDTPELRDAKSPLPPTPTVQIGEEGPILVARDCGAVPAIGEKPFWIDCFVPANPEDTPGPGSIYRRDDDAIRPYLRNKIMHIESVCKRQPSKRFHEFVEDVKIVPTMVDATEMTVAQQAMPVYRRARLSRLVTEKPTIPTSKFSKDNVESTLAECLKKIIRRNFETGVTEKCPIGLTTQERETFCWRLDLVENTVDLIGWKSFASAVMLLNNDDLEMIDEFSCKYKCQVVEVVLDHWYKLYAMRSDKCLQPATKQTIIEVLNKLEKIDLLYKLNWRLIYPLT